MNNDQKRKRNLKVGSIVVGVTLFTLILGGCIPMDQVNDNEKHKNYDETAIENGTEDMYVSVNEYTGEGFRLREGERNDPIAKESFDEIAEATKTFFLEEYKTEVIVHNAVGAIDGVMVFVESVGEPHFHTFALIPVDEKENTIDHDGIWSTSMEVEKSIYTGLLVMIMEEQFDVLDQYFKEITIKYPVTGLRQEAINNVKKSSYTTPYYFVQAIGENMDELVEFYINNPEIDKDELIKYFDVNKHKPERMNIAINLYMNKPDTEPNQELFEQIIKDIETMEGIPHGVYSIGLHENNISIYSATPKPDTSLRRGNLIK